MSASEVRYLSCAETAKLVRATLKASWPRTKFSVRSSTYSMGASIDVSWTDGPTSKQVDAAVLPFVGATFDGMTDMKSYRDDVLIAGADGAVELVSMGADFIFTHRGYSDGFLARRASTARPCRDPHGRQCAICFASVVDGWLGGGRFACSPECAARLAAPKVAAHR